MPNISKRLVVFSGVAHHPVEHGYVAHQGFVREIDIWARIFDQVLVVTRLDPGPARADDVPYAEPNISIQFLPAPQNTDGVPGKLKLAVFSLAWVWISSRILTSQDVLMARGPDSIGFLGWVVSRLNRLPRFAKYADQWENFEAEPLGYRLQKFFYRQAAFGGPVMIYGAQDERRPHLIPFFTSGVTCREWEQAGELVGDRPAAPPVRLLFVGRFVFFKGVDVLLNAFKILNDRRSDLVLELIGNGPELRSIQEQIERQCLRNVALRGWLGPQDLSLSYAQAHIFVHPSRKEGFGKVLLEAMSYGLPIVGADVGVSRELVEKQRCGILFRNGDAGALVAAIETLLSSADSQHEFSRNGRRVAQGMVLEALEQRYRLFVQENLNLT